MDGKTRPGASGRPRCHPPPAPGGGPPAWQEPGPTSRPLPRAPTFALSHTPASLAHVPVCLETGRSAAVNRAGPEHRHSSPHVCLNAYWGGGCRGHGQDGEREHPTPASRAPLGRKACEAERAGSPWPPNPGGRILPPRPLRTPGHGAWVQRRAQDAPSAVINRQLPLADLQPCFPLLPVERAFPACRAARTPSPASTPSAAHSAPGTSPSPSSTPRSHTGPPLVLFGSPRLHPSRDIGSPAFLPPSAARGWECHPVSAQPLEEHGVGVGWGTTEGLPHCPSCPHAAWLWDRGDPLAARGFPGAPL